MLSNPDKFYLESAEGWLELGNSAEAAAELKRISPAIRLEPDVMEVEWKICAHDKRWEDAAVLGRLITQAAPERAFGWIHLAFALHEMRRTKDARSTLAGVIDRFPDDWLMRYNMACYTCQLGKMDECRQWLDEACRLGDARQIKQMAKHDKDLEPLFPPHESPI